MKSITFLQIDEIDAFFAEYQKSLYTAYRRRVLTKKDLFRLFEEAKKRSEEWRQRLYEGEDINNFFPIRALQKK